MKSSSTQSKFHVGQKIRVVVGVKDPDYGHPIEGWSGSIEDIVLSDDGDGSWLYSIQWDRNTFNLMGRALQKNARKTALTLQEWFFLSTSWNLNEHLGIIRDRPRFPPSRQRRLSENSSTDIHRISFHP
jgi:hypothetical protein